jgi:twitching motility protein PilT
MRVGARLDVSSQAPMEARELEGQLLSLLTPEQRALLAQEQNIDTLLVTSSGLRCRAGFYRSFTGLNATFRLIRRTPPTLAELGLPGQLASFIGHSQGMVLVSGLAGSGKTSTLAALVNLIAEERAEHILCLEDPIEIVHPGATSPAAAQAGYCSCPKTRPLKGEASRRWPALGTLDRRNHHLTLAGRPTSM